MKLKETFEKAVAQARQFAIDLAGYFFQSRPCYFSRWLGWAGLLALFALGIGMWGNLLAWGNIDFQLADWNIITGRRLSALQDALLTGQAPFHVSDFMGLKGLTDRYLAIPDMFLSPQALLLRWMPLNLFVLANTLLMYAIGFAGLLAVRRRFHLSLAAFAALFFLFNFNGTITAHLVIGHFTWLGYFLLPFFALLIFDTPAGKLDWGWLLKLALLLTLIFIQGTFHLFVWCLMFLGFLTLFDHQRRKHAFWAAVFAVLFSLFRILPAGLDAGTLSVEFLTGFASSGDFLRGMLEIVQPSMDYTAPGNLVTHHIGWWEFDFYIGWVGLAFLAIFGIWRWTRQGEEMPAWARGLFLPLLSLFVLSIGKLYQPVFMLGIPLLTAERVTSRFWTLPLVFLILLAVIALQKYLDRARLGRFLLFTYLAGLLVLMADLQRHLDLWNVKFMDYTLPRELGDYHLTIQNNFGDAVYLNGILLGGLVSLLAILFAGVMFARQRRAGRRAG